MRNLELEQALYGYIKEHEEDAIDFQNITIAFPKYNILRLMQSLVDLRIDHKIDRIHLGSFYHKYVTLC